MKAFPIFNQTCVTSSGMDLKDFFAASIISGMASTGVAAFKNEDHEKMADLAYNLAKEMMKARTK